MGTISREPVLKRIFMVICFAFQYVYILLFRELPLLFYSARKSVTNQIVVITGGGRGLGKGLAKQFAIKEHAIVCILDINENDGLESVSEIVDEGGQAYFFKCDVSDSESVRACAKSIYSSPELGHVDILICNAAVLRMGTVLDLSDADFKTTTNVNILGYIYAVKSFVGDMMNRNRGQIVAIGSVCSHYGEYLGSAYCMSKFAVRGFMESLHMELIEKNNNITTTQIYPYFMDTPFIAEKQITPFSTFYELLPLDLCVKKITDAILREELYCYIPWHMQFLCVFCKCLASKHIIPAARRLFNFRYAPGEKQLMDAKLNYA
ncbi:unnamed protein product [Anisakis simplex]|uniref:Epidermal retinol dehydrogenase 2 (inferred by orthology to a human protein) n=1 Tax=Anisakis simplex TaxID=6269 RepID=A0A0M3KEJ7_ANISI|nr:unnamed protein product [Anisakis simplex]